MENILISFPITAVLATVNNCPSGWYVLTFTECTLTLTRRTCSNVLVFVDFYPAHLLCCILQKSFAMNKQVSWQNILSSARQVTTTQEVTQICLLCNNRPKRYHQV